MVYRKTKNIEHTALQDNFQAQRVSCSSKDCLMKTFVLALFGESCHMYTTSSIKEDRCH